MIHSLLAGLLLGLGYWVLGSPYPALLALVGALACLIPVVGAPLAVIPPLLVGLLTSVQLSLFTVLYTLVVLIALEVWVKPRLFNRRWDNPILTLVILLAMANAFGLLGIIVAPPLSVVCQILWSRLVSHRAVSGAAAQVSDLKERQARVLETIKAMDEPALALVTSSMERLTRLIEKAEPILQAGLPVAALPTEPSETIHSPQPVSAEGGPPVSKDLEETDDVRTPEWLEQWHSFGSKGIRSAHRLNERTHGWLGMLAGAAREALKPNSAITAAAIAYFALLSLFPLTLLSISIASFTLAR